MNVPEIFQEVIQEDRDGIVTYRILINGCWQCLISGNNFEVQNPATGKVIGRVPDCGKDDVLNAIQAAKNGATLMTLDPIARLEVMEKARALVLEHRDFLAHMITLESGKPLSIALSEVKSTAERLRLTMQEVRGLYGEYLPGEWVEDTRNKFAFVVKKPLGVVASISTFNYPLFIAASKIIPAVLACNSVVAKPSSDTPISLILFVRILEKAGMPAGTINIVTGKGGVIGDQLVRSPDVAAVSFTGSTKVGETIASQAGIKKLHLELGGKASAIVLEDADLDMAAVQICKGTFRNSGQRCDAVSRVLVHEKVKDAFLAKVLEETKKYRTGDPMDPKTQMGTVINQKAVERIDALVRKAVMDGAKLLAGGKTNGLFYEATVLDGVRPEMEIACEEIFGPVMPILTIGSHQEAVKISNDSEYGLDSCVFTKNIDLAMKISHELQDGSVTINGIPAHGVGHFPFGGNKKSGMGREGINYSIDELTRLHTIIITQNDAG
jgi:acyl-CoA reductase-like NAD-dependent aldehyde dehydrogenase